MPFNPFSELTSKIFGGVALLLIVFSTIQHFTIKSLREDVAEYKVTQKINLKSIKDLKASLGEAEDSIKEAKVVAEAKQEEARRALAKAQIENQSILNDIDRVNRARESHVSEPGVCETPDVIMQIEGL